MNHSDLDVYFHRLAPSAPSDDALAKFYEDGYVLCHYGDKASFSVDDYSESPGDLEAMVDAADSGGICLVQLNADNVNYERDRRLGIIPPGTDPFIIGVREDGTRTERYTDPDEAAQKMEAAPGVEYIYKGIQLQDIRILEPHEYLVSAYEPPSTTFCRWRVVEDQIEAFLRDEPLPSDEPTSYSPDQLERLCEEYLREEYEYFPLIQPGGASGINQSFDLVGGIGDRRVFGEVKNTKEPSESALSDLESVTGEETLSFYFSRNPVEKPPDSVEIVLLEDVLDGLSEIKRTRLMMDRMSAY